MQNKSNRTSVKKRGAGDIQKKILLLLLGGITLGLTHSPKKYFSVLKEIRKEWGEINRTSLNRAIRSLYKSKLVGTKTEKNGTFTLILSKNGERIALSYNLEKMKIKIPTNWDKKWRVVMFDVPERLKKVRESLRYHLRNIGFCELQKSVFIHPFPCDDEIEYITEFYNARQHIRFLLVEEVDNNLDLKKHFQLI